MILTFVDVASSLRHWELAEYVSEGFVILGCAGELVADLATRIPRRKRKHLERWSTILLVVALTIGLKCLIRTNELSGSAIGSLGDKAGEADTKAKTAIADSSTALSQAKDALGKAGSAQHSLAKAEDEANEAQVAASNAVTFARDARKEADSFEKDIVSAKKQAADAETHLADSLQQAAAAQLALDRLRAPRSLTLERRERIASKLKLFPKRQFDLALTNLPEAAEFSLMVENTLKMAGWTEIDWTGGDIVSTRSSGPTTGFVTVTGVIIQMHKEQVPNFWSEATALAEALRAEGIDAKAEPGVGPPNTNVNAVHILIGEKPK